MAQISIYNLEGKKVAEKDLGNTFTVENNPKLFAQAVNYQLANRRRTIAHTKNRGEVSGGGRKPFKQKGTGNARAGSTRSPLWIGGGVTFGPRKIRNYQKRIPAKMLKQAIKMVLTQKIKNKKMIVLKQFEMPEISTKQVYNLFSKLPIEEGKILVILAKLNANTELSLANIPYAKVMKAENINIFDLTKYDYLVITDEALDKIKDILK